jgi:TrmH family RNA methyltransferase
MNVFSATNEETLSFLQKNRFQFYTTFMDETAEDLYKKNFIEKSALFFSEQKHSGLSDFWLHKGENILIPMSGTIDSLNLSNACGYYFVTKY